jgi:putative flippase GtrA
MPLHTFTYAACGAANSAIGFSVYVICYYWVFRGKIFDFGFYAFEPHVASLIVSSFVSFSLGFILNRYVVFTGSYLRGRIQLVRYLLSFIVNLAINYLLLKLFIQFWGWNAVISQVISISLVVVMSYFTQRHFSFRIKKDGHAEFTDLK